MPTEVLAVIGVIAAFSVVQSIFGLGILVFGTPTLLLMGYPFTETLTYLLPASLAISLLQVSTAGAFRPKVSPFLFTVCLPGIVAGLWAVGASEIPRGSDYLVGITLLASAILRLSGSAERQMAAFLRKHLAIYHLVMGLVHGLTNLGGAMLSILAIATNSEKPMIRNTVAIYYLVFGIVQIVVLIAVLEFGDAILSNMFTAVISSATYLLVGNRLFLRVDNPRFNLAFSGFMAAYGIVVLLQA